MDLTIDQLFTTDSLLTLQGGALAAWVVPTVLDYVFVGKLPAWLLRLLSLLIALGLSFYAVTLSDDSGGWTWVVALLNAFLITFTALGLNKSVEKLFGKKAQPQPEPAREAAPTARGGDPMFGGSVDAAPSAPAQQPAPGVAKSAKRPTGFARGWL
jgi:hypothetical protein